MSAPQGWSPVTPAEPHGGTLAPCASTRTHRAPVTHDGEHVTTEGGVSGSLPKGRGQQSKEELGGSWVTRAVPRGSSDCDACEREAARKKQTRSRQRKEEAFPKA